MKTPLFLALLFLVCVETSCKKNQQRPQTAQTERSAETGKFGPLGKNSVWKSVGGDTIYSAKLTLSFFFTETFQPCNICYYQQNYSLWNDYDYTFSISECATVGDTLVFTNIDTHQKGIFKREP